MAFYWRVNYDNPKSAENEAKRLAKRTGVNITGFRSVLGRYRPGSTKSAMDRAHKVDKKQIDDKQKKIEIMMKEGIRLAGTHLYSDKGEAEMAAIFLGRKGIKTQKQEGRLWYTPEDAGIGFYSNTTPSLKKQATWSLSKNYVTSVEEYALGTYTSYNLNPSSANNLYSWFKDQGIKFIVPPKEMHLTVVAARNEISNYKVGPNKIVLDPKTYSIEVLGEPGNYALVLRVSSDLLTKKYKKSVELGAEYTYKSFKPHITISYNWLKSRKITQIEPPPFPIILDKETMKSNNLKESILLPNLSNNYQQPKVSFSGELKKILLKFGYSFISSNIKNIMVFEKGGKRVLLYPEPVSGKKNSNEKWVQWVAETKNGEFVGLTPLELNTYLRSIKNEKH